MDLADVRFVGLDLAKRVFAVQLQAADGRGGGETVDHVDHPAARAAVRQTIFARRFGVGRGKLEIARADGGLAGGSNRGERMARR